MDTTLDLSRWRDAPLGVMHRRGAIVSVGLRQLLRTRFFRILLFLAWTTGLVMAIAGFLFTQSIATGGWLESFAADQGPRAAAIASAFTAVVLLYPDICIGGLFTLLFWVHSFVGLMLSLVALTVVVPSLITRDRASNALSIYLSRPLTSLDYLLGKLGVIIGIIVLTWTGPLVFAWVLSMLVAPDGDFFIYSLEPLARAGLFNLIGLVTLASIALGVSSATRTTAATILLWIGLWTIAGTIAKFPTSPVWLRAASFSHGLNTVRDALFNLEEILGNAARSLPFLNADVTQNLNRMAESNQVQGLDTALIGLAVLVTASTFFLFRRLRPE